MSTWDYRIVKHRDGSGFGLHEVYYDDAQEPWATGLAGFSCDANEGPEGLIRSIELALADAKERPVLEEPTGEWPGKRPSSGGTQVA